MFYTVSYSIGKVHYYVKLEIGMEGIMPKAAPVQKIANATKAINMAEAEALLACAKAKAPIGAILHKINQH